jgi:integrase
MPTVRLRQDSIRTLAYVGSDNAQCIYWDAALPSFGLRVYPHGRRSYVYAYRANGRKRIATIGRADVLTLELARKKGRVSLGDVAGGKDPQESDDALWASGTVRSLCEEYVERHAKPKKRSWKSDESILERRVIPKLGARLVASITSDDVSRLHAEIGAEAPYAANRTLEIIRKMFNLARTWRCVPQNSTNPASGIEDFPEVKRRRYVTKEEMPRLAAAIEVEPNEYVRNALWLLLLTGLRCNELLRAKWCDVDWHDRTLHVGQTKNGDPVLAPLSHAAVSRLKAVPRLPDNPHIICGAIKGQHLINLAKPWTRVRKAAGIQDVRIHDLRRTVGSWLVRGGASLHLVGAVLNHRDQKTTAGYAYFQTADRTQALDKHGALVEKLARPKRASRRHVEPRHLTLTREELHRLVWAEPIATVARRLGVSDVGLAKACRRAHVPAPGRGYWAKLKRGKTVEQCALPSGEDGVSQQIAIRLNSQSIRGTKSSATVTSRASAAA